MIDYNLWSMHDKGGLLFVVDVIDSHLNMVVLPLLVALPAMA